MKKLCNKIVILTFFTMFLLEFTCTVVRDHPLDIHGNNYIPPEITIDTEHSTILPDDTIHFDSGTIVLSDGKYPMQFRYTLLDADWNKEKWQSEQQFHLDGLEDGNQTVIIQARYTNGDATNEDTVSFHVRTSGYTPSFTDTTDSAIVIPPGDRLEITISPTGRKQIRYQWYKADSLLEGKNDSVLIFEVFSFADTGSYFCSAVNDYGTAVSRRFILSAAKHYQVIYKPNDADDGEVPVDDSLYLKNALVIVRSNEGGLSRDGFIFAGWRTTSDNSGLSYVANAKIAVDTMDIVLYAWWTDEPVYSVTYHSSQTLSGSVPVDNNEYIAGTGVVVLDNTGNLVKKDTTFLGWSRDSTESGKLYAPDDTVIIGDADLSLYARWTKTVYYQVTYNANNADKGDVPEDTVHYHFGEMVHIKGNSGNLLRTGYTFTVWNTAPNGTGTDYRENDSLEINGEDIILYAQWTDNPTFTVTYNGNGSESGEIPVDSRRYEEGESVTVAANSGDMAIKGKTFTGWNTEKEGDNGSAYTPNASFLMGTKNVTLYARWTTNPTYTITYHGNSNTGGTVPSAVSDEVGVVVSIAAQGSMVNTGHTFTGWNSFTDGSGKEYAPNDLYEITEHDDTLFAQWEINQYTVSYDGNGENVINIPQPTTHRYDVEMTLDNGVPEWIGHTFFRWNTSKNGDGEDYRPGDKFTITDKNITFYARWTVNRYLISYNGNESNGGSVPENDTIAFGDNVKIAGKGDLKRTGFTFTGWNTKADGSGNGYPADTTIIIGTTDMELFAQWNINRYTVRFLKNDNNAEGNMMSQSIPYDSTAHLTDNNFTKEGWRFVGWSGTADGMVEYSNNAWYTMKAQDDTLYAQWTVNSYILTFSKNDDNASGAMDSLNLAYDSTVTLPDIGFAKTGWDFSGWMTNQDDDVAYGNSAAYTMGAKDDTLYAKWIKNPDYREPVPVFLFSGQSNMICLGSAVSDLPSEDQNKTYENIKIHNKSDNATSGWSTLKPGFGADADHFGPELYFGKVLSDSLPGRKFAFIKDAHSGTYLGKADGWLPPSSGGPGTFYENMANHINNALESFNNAFDTSAYTPRWAGFIWLQGEFDAMDGNLAEKYEENLTNLINDIREMAETEDLPAIIPMIAPLSIWSQHQKVRDAEVAVAENIINVDTMDTEGLDFSDGVHFNAASQIIIGTVCAKRWLAMEFIKDW